MTDPVLFIGWESSSRRETIVEGGMFIVMPDGRLLDGRPYLPKGVTYLAKMPEAFQIDTERGVLKGRSGDYMAVGLMGEMFVVKAGQVAQRYDEVVDVAFLE